MGALVGEPTFLQEFHPMSVGMNKKTKKALKHANLILMGMSLFAPAYWNYAICAVCIAIALA